jgi:hypothetical protein
MTEETSTESADLGTQALEIAKRRQTAALAVLQLFEKHFDQTVGSHPETVLHAAAWLAGTSLYRSFGYKEEQAPGTIMLSEKANEEWPKLMKTFVFLVEKDGIKLKPDELILNFPGEHGPKKSILEIQAEFQDEYNKVMQANGFDFAEGGKTGAVVCAMLVKAYCVRRKDLEPALAAGIVEMGFIEGAKTSPAPLKPT